MSIDLKNPSTALLWVLGVLVYSAVASVGWSIGEKIWAVM